MGKYIAERTIKMLIAADKQVHNARVAILGLSFKENVPDFRNTRVIDIITELKEYGVEVLVHDPLALPEEARRYCSVDLVSMKDIHDVDAIILAVAHRAYQDMGLAGIAALCHKGCSILIDIKAVFESQRAHSLGIHYWRL